MAEAQGQSPTRPWDLHGPLQVSDNRRYLQYADGAPFFWLGDTAWSIASLNPDEVDLYLGDRAAKRFTVIQLNLTAFGRGDYAGRQPFLGEGHPWPDVRLNEAYWSNVDDVLAKAAALGLHVVLFSLWGDHAGHPGHAFFTRPEQHNYDYGVAIGQRYGGLDHAMWCASGEYDKIGIDEEGFRPTGLTYLRRLAEGIRDGCPDSPLMTFHPWAPRSSSAHWHDADWLSFNMIQTFGHDREGLELVRHDYRLSPTKPVLNGEPGYEDRHLYLPDRGVMDAWHTRLEAYTSLFAGAFGYTYGHVTIWHFDTVPDRGTGWKGCLDRPGAIQMRHVRALMESKPITSRVPDDALIASRQGQGDTDGNTIVATRDRDRTWAFVYTSKGYPFTLDVGRLAGDSVRARWYDPRTGGYREIGALSGLETRAFAPPGEPGRGNDWVLVVETG